MLNIYNYTHVFSDILHRLANTETQQTRELWSNDNEMVLFKIMLILLIKIMLPVKI